jgi:GTP-binding protein EngB required for normal cell division
MDVRQYEHTKFQMAELLRSAELALRREHSDQPSPFTDLFARLAEDRFNVVVAGRFNRGKSSLMNALLRCDRLPVGIVPVTSVITTVAYGSEEEAFIEYEGRRIPERVDLDLLPDYVSQQGNPGNVRGVAMARVLMPAEIMRRGFYFVDTPGLGSSIAENTDTTRVFLPQADAILLVTSYDSPLSEEEFATIESAASSGRPLFIIINKQDIASAAEREEIRLHILGQLESLGSDLPPLFSVSARAAFDNVEESGVANLERELIRFLIEKKQEAFIRNMWSRIEDALQIMPDRADRRRLIQEFRGGGNASPIAEAPNDGDTPQRFLKCEICKHVEDALFAFLSDYQYAIIADNDERRSLAERGQLCALHLWQYVSLASPLGICAAFAPRLERLAHYLRDSTARDQVDVESEACRACKIRYEVEQRRIHHVSADTTLCLPHMSLVADASDDGDRTHKLVCGQADLLERVAEDMYRYALKVNANRRFLLSTEERSAAERGLTLLVGSRILNTAQRPY